MNWCTVLPDEEVPVSQACNRQGVYCVPLYDTLGENAVEYILDHSESTIAFVSAANLGMPHWPCHLSSSPLFPTARLQG